MTSSSSSEEEEDSFPTTVSLIFWVASLAFSHAPFTAPATFSPAHWAPSSAFSPAHWAPSLVLSLASWATPLTLVAPSWAFSPAHWAPSLVFSLASVHKVMAYIVIKELIGWWEMVMASSIIYEPKEEEKVKVEKESKEDLMKEYIAAANRLDNAKLVLRRYFKVDNELREPVTKEEIISEVARQLLVQIKPENLHMPSPLGTLGEHEIPLRLPKAIPLPEGKISRTLKVKIRRK